ncbi:MAG: asparagine synthase (glutamine-hydrolyzing) [Rickettsiales bacterium]
MCGIAGTFSLNGSVIPGLASSLACMNKLIAHRGPDGQGVWQAENHSSGLAHRRLSIIDLTENAAQPMRAENGTVISYNGEIYNYRELHEALQSRWPFKSKSDTETILAAYEVYGQDCLSHLRGMFAFAIVDQKTNTLFAARDRFGIKPFYYTIVDDVFYFASEIKALLPFVPDIKTNPASLTEYFMFQYTLGEETMFEGIKQLMPGHCLTITNGKVAVRRYWDVEYNIDFHHTSQYFEERMTELFHDSAKYHLRSDVPVGSYLSGGVDSSLISLLAAGHSDNFAGMFNGRFTDQPGYDESQYAQIVADKAGHDLHIATITANDFASNIENIIYHLDQPVAGPGSFPQYMTSKLASEHVSVILGGQGGDEIFGGYARYTLAYFEQCIKAAIEGTYKNGDFVVTPESIIPNLTVLKEYKPLMKQFWKEGLFEGLDDRYLRLCDRSTDISSEVNWSSLDKAPVVSRFKEIFNNEKNTGKQAYFDKMTHYDFKCLLPALLHVEDRVSMAHGLEARVPLLDHNLVEFAATIPADIKFKGGRMKHLIKETFSDVIPSEISERKDKMGFPVPLKEWFSGELNEFVRDIFHSQAASTRTFVDNDAITANMGNMGQFSRRIWGFLSLELWQQQFHDRASYYRNLRDEKPEQEALSA